MGVENVLVQLALEFPASRLVGLEIRSTLVDLSISAILDHQVSYPQLHRVQLHGGSIEDPSIWPQLLDSTVILADNKLF